MLGPLPVCTWLDGVLSKNGMILSRRDGFASYFKANLKLEEPLLDFAHVPAACIPEQDPHRFIESIGEFDAS